MTISVAAGLRECFFHSAIAGDVIEIDYQVIDGGHGDFDISFELVDPSGRILYADFKKTENSQRHRVNDEGDYRFCFDNTFSRFNPKTVFFEIIVENEDAAPNAGDDEWNNDATLFDGLTPEEFYDMKVEDLQNAFGRIRTHLSKARQVQDLLKSFEARDRNIAEENYFRVNVWSMFQIFLMIAVGSIQVWMLRSLFEIDSNMNQFWKLLWLK